MLVSEAFTITEQRLTEMAAFHPMGTDQESYQRSSSDYTEFRPLPIIPPISPFEYEDSPTYERYRQDTRRFEDLP